MKKIRNALKKLAAMLKHLFTLNDNPHDIALGFGLGVFLGVLPGTGPVAALICAQFLRVNRAAAFFGAAVTNTWFSFVVLGISAHIGARIMSINPAELTNCLQAAFKPFSFHKLSQLSFSQVIVPLFTGFLIVSVSVALLAYSAAFLALHAHRSLKKPPNHQ
jgi:uncharacterized protein